MLQKKAKKWKPIATWTGEFKLVKL